MLVSKVKIRFLLHALGYKLSDVLVKNKDIIVYGFSEKLNCWCFWKYKTALFGLGSVSIMEGDLSEDEALFKRDILLSTLCSKVGDSLDDKDC